MPLVPGQQVRPEPDVISPPECRELDEPCARESYEVFTASIRIALQF